jgi:hypothetical protein
MPDGSVSLKSHRREVGRVARIWPASKRTEKQPAEQPTPSDTALHGWRSDLHL